MKKMIAVVVLMLAFAVPAFGANNPPSISLNETNVSLGDYVTFTTVVPNNVHNPRVEVLCYQNNQLVYGEGGAPQDSFLLGGGASTWLTVGGPADCVANLYYFTWKANHPDTVYLATTSFSAGG